jgi:uncharacterized membrane protein
MGLVLVLAVLPPFVPPGWRPVLMAVFAPACHQIAARSPHIGEVAVAVCDRCIGIYSGVFVGFLLALVLRPLWRRVGDAGRFVLLGALVPLGIDWIGPVLGLWSNTPLSRGATGFVFGVVAASFLAHTLFQRVGSE